MIEYKGGVHLLGTDLWFDAKNKAEFSFISNANVARFTPPEKVIATPETIALLDGKINKSLALACPFQRQFTLGDINVELFPSGYSVGSAQISIDFEGKNIVYTGDIKLNQHNSVHPIEIRRCDTLIMKCNYSLPKYIFPSHSDSIASILTFIDDTINQGLTPVLLVEPLGNSELVIKSLGNRGYKLNLHRSIYETIKIYEQFGMKFPNYIRLRDDISDNSVIIMPIHLRDSEILERMDRTRVAAVIGCAEQDIPFLKTIFKTDEICPYGNHAGYDELLEYIEIAKPKEIFLVEGYTAEFAAVLKKRGHTAIPLKTPTQLKLF